MRVRVKICGVTRRADIEAATRAGVDAVGFVFAESARRLSLERAAELACALPAAIERVAVFRHPDAEILAAACQAIAAHTVQADAAALAGLRLPAGVSSLPVWRDGERPEPGAGRMLYEGRRSGCGELADWRTARALARSGPVYLAGGLDAANVGRAVARVRPYGVDVSSGVERDPGRKSVARILAFVASVREAERRLMTT